MDTKNFKILFDEIIKELAKKYFPVVSKWLFSSYKDVLKKRIESKECVRFC